MKSRAACFCLFGLLVCPTTGHPETFHQYRGKNGEMAFTNLLPAAPVSNEVQRAREQAEIEYWRAVEARARSSRMTPDTEVHRKRGTALQEENQTPSGGAAKKRYRRTAAKKIDVGLPSAGTWHPDSLESKRGRGRKMKGRSGNPVSKLDSRVHQGNREQVALK
jgi:hypothetical protein